MPHPRFLLLSFVSLAPVFCGNAQTYPRCEATPSEPVKVCFADPPLTIDHCRKLILPRFHVFRERRSPADDAYYYYTYQLTRDGHADPLLNPFQNQEQRYVLRSEDGPGEASAVLGNLPQLSYGGPGDYSVKVTVYVDGRPPAEADSGVYHLVDRPVVRSVLVGISNYENPSAANLLHADSDAKTFGALLQSLFPAGPAPVLLTSDSSDQKKLPTKMNILAQLQQQSGFCAPEDWFIFYFSGHGIVAFNSNGNQFAYYLSTQTFDPTSLRATAIRIGDLLNEIRNIPAKNKLVLLDSCFSGASSRPVDVARAAHNSGASTRSTLRRATKKVTYIQDDKPVDAFQVAKPDPNHLAGDTGAFDATSQAENNDNVHVLYLSAAGADHEAEEGYASYRNELVFVPADEENTPEQKAMGHGFFTYAWIWNLLKQTPKQLQLPNLAGELPKPAPAEACRINFEAAAHNTISQFEDLRLSHTDHAYQHPELSGSKQVPGSVECSVFREH